MQRTRSATPARRVRHPSRSPCSSRAAHLRRHVLDGEIFSAWTSNTRLTIDNSQGGVAAPAPGSTQRAERVGLQGPANDAAVGLHERERERRGARDRSNCSGSGPPETAQPPRPSSPRRANSRSARTSPASRRSPLCRCLRAGTTWSYVGRRDWGRRGTYIWME